MKKATGIEKRSAILYARVKPSSKLHIKELARVYECSESDVLDSLIQTHKFESSKAVKKHASHKK